MPALAGPRWITVIRRVPAGHRGSGSALAGCCRARHRRAWFHTEMRQRFDRAYAARKKAGHTMPVGRGIWLSLYEKEASASVSLVGGGIGLAHPPIAKVPLTGPEIEAEDADSGPAQSVAAAGASLTIAEAKRGLARSFGVSEDAIETTIRG